MKIEILKNDLVRLLQKTQNIIEKRNTMPILANVLLVADDGRLSVFATDLEVSLRDEVPAKTETKGKVAVSAKNLFELVKELADGPVSLSRKGNNWLEVKSRKAVFNIVGNSSEEFPAFPEYQTTGMAQVPAGVLRDMIEKTLYSVSNDETRYHLNGVFFEKVESANGSFFRMVATDGHRLSLVERATEDSGALKKAQGVIIPRKGLIEFRKLLEGEEGTIQMGIEDSHLVIRHENAILLIRLIEGRYPNYQQLIPTTLQRKVIIPKDEFYGAIKRVSLLSNQKSRGITLAFKKNSMEIYSNNPELGDTREELDVVYGGEELKIGFNARYLMDILTTMNHDELSLELNDQLSPGIVRPAGDNSYTCVVMPMRI